MKIVSNNKELIEAIQLTEEEVREAIREAKLKKYFHLKSKDYWNEQERTNDNNSVKPL